jgi:hypothetical protein
LVIPCFWKKPEDVIPEAGVQGVELAVDRRVGTQLVDARPGLRVRHRLAWHYGAY